MSPPLTPTPPSPPIISRQSKEEDDSRVGSSRSHHRTTRDNRPSRSRSRGRGKNSRSPLDRKHRQRSHSRSRSRERTRYHSTRRHRHDRSRSRSKIRNDKRRRNSQRSRSRSHTKVYKGHHKSRSRSTSRSRRRHNRSKSRSRDKSRRSRSRSKKVEERNEIKKQQPNVIVLSTESYKDSLKSLNRQTSTKEEGSSANNSKMMGAEATPSWKSVKTDQVGVYSNLEPDEPIDKEKIHKEIEEKLRIALAKEGKVYPYPKPEPSHPVFANDGSFLEIFKKMQQQQTFVQQQVGESMQIHAVPATSVVPAPPALAVQQPPPPPQLPIFGRRRGGKILKTGVVAKPKAPGETESSDVKDFWSIYLREVKKYKSTACESDSKTRPLVR